MEHRLAHRRLVAAKSGDEPFDRRATHRFGRLRRAGEERRVGHDLYVVERDDRQVLGHTDTQLAGRVDQAEAEEIVSGNDRRWAVRAGQQVAPGAVTTFTGVRRTPCKSRRNLQVVVVQRVAEPPLALARRRDIRRTGDQADAPVAVLDQVIGQ